MPTRDYTADIHSAPPVDIDHAIQVHNIDFKENENPKLAKVVIIASQSKFETLKNALTSIGITGLTVTQVLGFGMQKGNSNFYRGIEVDVTLRPKVKLEMVVCKIPVSTVVILVI